MSTFFLLNTTTCLPQHIAEIPTLSALHLLPSLQPTSLPPPFSSDRLLSWLCQKYHFLPTISSASHTKCYGEIERRSGSQKSATLSTDWAWRISAACV